MYYLKNLIVPTILLLIMFCLTPVSDAYFSYGARATGMGGAFTAMADDGSLIYWNPGSLALINGWIIEMQYGSDGEFAEDTRETMDFLRDWVDDGSSDLGDVAGYASFSEKDWLVRGGDTISLVIANKASAFHFCQYNLFYLQHNDDEETSLQYEMTGIEIKEYGVTFSIAGGSGSFALGVTAKYVDADAYHATPAFWEIPSTDPGDLFDHLKRVGSRSSDNNWGMDAGIMMNFGTSRVGFTARNILKYDIEIDENTKVEVKPEYRMGYAYKPSDRFVFSMDYSIGKETDLLGNDLDGSELATGFEVVFGEKEWLILRGGVSLPFEGDAPMIFTVGGGLNFQHAILDVGYAMDQDRDTEKIWTGLRFMF
ncbi:conjugal transfer protein TraF [bacterium]|nr:conjugal transfer protein TraF [bacterium]